MISMTNGQPAKRWSRADCVGLLIWGIAIVGASVQWNQSVWDEVGSLPLDGSHVDVLLTVVGGPARGRVCLRRAGPIVAA